MRPSRLAILAAAAWLFCLPSLALARTVSATSMQGVPAGPAGTATTTQPPAWSSLSAAQQHLLAPLQGQWNRLAPARRHRLAEQARHWAALPQARQHQIQERLARWARMTPGQRRQLRANLRAFRNLSPDERARVSEAFEKFQALPPAQRRALRERWRTMSPEQRKRWAAEQRDQPGPASPPARNDH